jgi:hypothetical protein
MNPLHFLYTFWFISSATQLKVNCLIIIKTYDYVPTFYLILEIAHTLMLSTDAREIKKFSSNKSKCVADREKENK